MPIPNSVTQETPAAPAVAFRTTGPATAPAHYRLNRRAALLLSGVFLIFGLTAGVVCWVRLAPNRAVHHLRSAGELALQNGDWRGALIQFGNLVQQLPSDAAAWRDLGQVHLRLAHQGDDKPASLPLRTEHLRSAISCYRRSVELDPQHAATQRLLLELDLRAGNWGELRARRESLGSLLQDDPLLRLAWEITPSLHADRIRGAQDRLAQLNRQEPETGDDAMVQAVIAELSPLADEAPADLDLLEPLTLALTHQGDHAAAAARLAEAEQIVGPSGKIDYLKARCALQRDDWQAAQQWALQACRSPAAEWMARFLLAEILLRSGKNDSPKPTVPPTGPRTLSPSDPSLNSWHQPGIRTSPSIESHQQRNAA